MPGFFITNCLPATPTNFTSAPCVQERMEMDGYVVYRNTRNQFMLDKLFYCDKKIMVVLEGVILNKTELIKSYGVETFEAYSRIAIRENPNKFFESFRGMFSGAVYFAEQKKWIVFADQIGNKAVFYYADKNGRFIVGSQLNYVTDAMRANSLGRSLDPNGARQLLSYGSFLDDSTCLSEVKRILPGDGISFQAGVLDTFTYYRLPEREDCAISNQDAIELLDRSFCAAMARGIKKNQEYGYTGVLDISGGADSRMIAYTAQSMLSANEIMLHYSQIGSYEEKIAEAIASELGYEFFFHALDDARFLADIDKLVAMNSGTGYYCGITGGERALKQLSGTSLGIEFTGLLGDVYEGAMLTSQGQVAPTLGYGRYRMTTEFKGEPISVNTLNRFSTNNAFWLFARGMMCGMSTFFTRQNYVEPFTPYGDIDFLEACMSIPWDKKVNDRLQLRWLEKCHPEAMAHCYAATGMKLLHEFRPSGPLLKKINAARNLCVQRIKKYSKFNMNPFPLWETKDWLRTFIDNYYCENMQLLKSEHLIDEELCQHLENIYKEGGMAKYNVLTFVSYCKQYVL